MPIKMVASRTHYAKREEHEYKPGEVFEVESERDARMLEKRKRATRYQEQSPSAPEPTPAPRVARRRTVTADPPQPSEPASDSGLYTRRDMRAED